MIFFLLTLAEERVVWALDTEVVMKRHEDMKRRDTPARAALVAAAVAAAASARSSRSSSSRPRSSAAR